MSATAVAITLDALLDQAPPIRALRVHALELRKTDPTWRFALAANPSSPGFLLELVADGATGWGAAGEIQHLGHGLAGIRAMLDSAVTALRGGDRSGLALLGGPARAIVHSALADLVARTRDEPVHAMLGPQVRESVAVTRILALKAPEQMAAVALGHYGEGYRHLKVKLDNEAGGAVDIARLRAIRAAVGAEVGLTIDANQSYSALEALRLVDVVADLGITVFEQPVPADDLAGLAWLTARSAIPIEADECADSLERIREIADRAAAHGVSLKLAKLGGLDRALDAVAVCDAAGIAVRIGAHVGSQLLNAAALHLAAVLPKLHEPAELAEFARLTGDPATGLEIADGSVAVPVTPGLGVTVSPPEALTASASTEE